MNQQKQVIVGLTALVLSVSQAFFVNNIRQTALLGMLLYGILSFANKEQKKLSLSLIGIGVLHLIGIFRATVWVGNLLSLLNFTLGLIFLFWGMWLLFLSQAKLISKISQTFLAILVLFISGFFALTTVAPSVTMGWLGAGAGSPGNQTGMKEEMTSLNTGEILISNVQYDKEIKNGYLDIYYTKAANSRTAPTLVFFHGGGYVWGDKSMGDPNAEISSFDKSTTGRFLAQGYNVVQMNYALAPEYPYPTAIKQINRGLKFLVEQAENYGLDMGNIVIGGGSAGGNLAGVLINIQTNPAYAKAMGLEAAIKPSAIKAAIFEGGLFDNARFGKTKSAVVDWSFTQLARIYFKEDDFASHASLIKNSNVLDHVTAAFPASFISDGNTGTFNDQAEDMAKTLTNLGVTTELKLYPTSEAKLAHGFEESGSKYADQTFNALFEFLEEKVNK